MSTKAKQHRDIDDYMDLIRRFPLRAIRSEAEYEQAGRILNGLLGADRPLSAGEADYTQALADLSKIYEDSRGAINTTKMTPLRALRYLMEQSGTNAEGIGKIIGSQPAASLVLNGKRQLSKTHILRLAAHFKVSPALFLGKPGK